MTILNQSLKKDDCDKIQQTTKMQKISNELYFIINMNKINICKY